MGSKNDGLGMGPEFYGRLMIARIATCEIEDITTEDGKNAAAVALGRMGGKARALKMTAAHRKAVAAGARHASPARILAPQRRLARIGPVLRA
jgi:hypothetical protein